jgi:hypothetical protein
MLSIPFYLLAAQMHDMHAGHEMPYAPDPFSLFNHHLAGVLVIFLSLFTFLEESPFGKKHSWVKFLWPTPLILEALNVILRGDSELTWPIRLATIMPDSEAVQHKIFALVALAIALIELFRRTGRLTHPGWRYIFYGLMLGGGIALLFHTGHHTAKIHRQHLWMGSWAIAAALTKVLADARPQTAWLRLYALPAFLLALGLQLAFYVE